MRRDKPNIPIAPILEAFGFENVPHVHEDDRWAKVRCGFHGDTRPSASVSRFGFVCYACGRSGDAVKLLREEENLTYAAAVERATSLAGGENPSRGSKPRWGRYGLFD